MNSAWEPSKRLPPLRVTELAGGSFEVFRRVHLLHPALGTQLPLFQRLHLYHRETGRLGRGRAAAAATSCCSSSGHSTSPSAASRPPSPANESTPPFMTLRRRLLRLVRQQVSSGSSSTLQVRLSATLIAYFSAVEHMGDFSRGLLDSRPVRTGSPSMTLLVLLPESAGLRDTRKWKA